MTNGSVSSLFSVSKLKSSTIIVSLRAKFALSITCLNASCLLTNQPCLGLLNVPYLSLGLRSGSGTIRPLESYPSKLSIHFLSISALGILVSKPSVRI